MTKAQTINVQLTPNQARIVGQEILVRIGKSPIPHPKLAMLPDAAKRLIKASRRWSSSSAQRSTVQTLWELPRDEALALFHYISFFFYPMEKKRNLTLPKDTETHFREVALALAERLVAKPGPEKQSDADDQYVLSAHEQSLNGTLPNTVMPPDPGLRSRINKRQMRKSMLLATKINQIPQLLQQLMSK
jgi:hypothetical protein